MACYRNVIAILLFIFVAIPRPVFAEEVLSDDQAYERVYSYCYSRVSPMWSPKPGEKPPRRTAADRERNARLTVECMKEQGVPVRYDMSAGIVRTGKGFGKNVHMEAKNIFPQSVLSPDTISREMPEVLRRLKDIPLPKLEAKDMIPPDMRDKYRIDMDKVDIDEELKNAPEYLRSRFSGNTAPEDATDRQGSADAIMSYEYEADDEAEPQTVKDTVSVKDTQPSKEDEMPARRGGTYRPAQSDDTSPSDNVSAAGQQDESRDGYEVKPIFLGR